MRSGQTAEALFLIPTNLTRPFFASLLQYCETHVNDVFGDRLRTILRYVPRDEEEFHATQVVSLLRREFRQSENIRVLVVAPTGSSQLMTEIVDFMTREKIDIPIIAVTIPFRCQSLFRRSSLAMPNYVICNSKEGTRKLGADAASRFSKQQRRLNVVMIHGPKGRIDSCARLSGFKQGLIESGRRIRQLNLSGNRVYCDWNAAKAQETFKRIVQSERKEIHVVFAANDEMALGVRRAIDSLPDKHKKYVRRCVIYGFDAIPEMRDLINGNGPHIKGTLEQPMDDMARKLVDLIKLASGDKRSRLASLPEGSGEFADPKPILANHAPKQAGANQRPDAPPPHDGSDDWALSTDRRLLPEDYGDANTLRRHARKRECRHQDRYGEYGVCGKRVVRKYRVIDDKVYWYIKDWKRHG